MCFQMRYENFLWNFIYEFTFNLINMIYILQQIKQNYSVKFKIFGTSQNPDTTDYIVIHNYYLGEYCTKCDQRYDYIFDEWCKSCQRDYFKGNFTNWTSGDKGIDDFIQKLQLEISKPSDTVFEWIPYNQFNDINEIGRNDYATVYSAVWKDGPLNYVKSKHKYIRDQNTKVVLKCLYNSQINTNKFLNKV